MNVISAENISKLYLIDHQRQRKGSVGYRDVLVHKAKYLFNAAYRREQAGIITEKEEFWALKDVNFNIQQGDRVGIVGHNGAGKSTMLKVLSRITEPTTGSVRIKGRVASLLEVGTGFHPELTGRENIALNGAILGMKQTEINRHFEEIVDFAGVEKFLDTPVKRYSSGMYVRLGFAIAAHLEPEILIIDEVLAVGDAEFQKKCLGKMNDLSESGRTLIFVSHNLVAVASLCNKAMFMQKGQLLEMGETNHVIANYMAKINKTSYTREWETPQSAPGNDIVRIKSIKIEPELLKDQLRIDVRTPLKVKFEFWNFLEKANLNLSMHFNSMTGETIFNVGTQVQEFSQGLITGECTIPGGFLNDGTYTITMMIVKDTSTVLYHLQDSIVFEIDDFRENVAWYGKWPGAVRPKFNFPIQQSSNQLV